MNNLYAFLSVDSNGFTQPRTVKAADINSATEKLRKFPETFKDLQLISSISQLSYFYAIHSHRESPDKEPYIKFVIVPLHNSFMEYVISDQKSQYVSTVDLSDLDLKEKH